MPEITVTEDIGREVTETTDNVTEMVLDEVDGEATCEVQAHGKN